MFQPRGAGAILVSRAASNTLFALLNCCTSPHLTDGDFNMIVTVSCSWHFLIPALLSLSPQHIPCGVGGLSCQCLPGRGSVNAGPGRQWASICDSLPKLDLVEKWTPVSLTDNSEFPVPFLITPPDAALITVPSPVATSA